jgi:hypothetical protein
MNEPGPVLLIHPPVCRPCEPPPGLARLAGALKRRGIPCRVLDANLEGLIDLLRRPLTARDTWTRRAVSGVDRHLAALRQAETYAAADRYRRAVSDLNRVLVKHGETAHARIGLANYEDHTLSALRAKDLIHAFETPEKTPFYPYLEKQMAEVFATAGDPPRLVGISVNYLSQALCAFAAIGIIRRLDPAVRILLGGGLVSSWMKRPGWRNPFSGIVDGMVCGPGEGALLVELGMPPDGDGPDFPDFSGFPLDRYLSPGRVIPYSASSGCYWRKCAFCPERAEKTPYRPLPGERVVSQLRGLVDADNPRLIHLTDNAVSPAHLRRLSKSPLGAPWYGFVRIAEELADERFCKDLRAAGCVMLQIGIESGSQRVLDAFGKGIDLDMAEKVLATLKCAGIAAYVYLLFGTPWEAEADAKKTLGFTVRNAANISFLNLAVFNLPAHGPSAGLLDTSDFYGGDLALYRDFTHPGGWDRKRVRQFLDKTFRRHPAIAPILRRDPPVFTSSHAPFFCR